MKCGVQLEDIVVRCVSFVVCVECSGFVSCIDFEDLIYLRAFT
jgi:hypothetical protein